MSRTAASTWRAGLSDTLAAEWIKLTTLRSTYITLGLGVALSIAMTALVSVAVGSTQDELPADLAPATFSLVGNLFALTISAVFGVMVVTGEYSSGMVRLTLTATPSRGRVFWAKFLLVTPITLVFGLITTLGMFLVGQAVLEAYGLPVTDLGDPDARRMVLGMGALMPVFPLIGLALGFLLRSTAGAITSVLALLWLPTFLVEFFPMWWRSNIFSLFPGAGVDSLALGHVVDSPVYSDPAIGALIVVAWIAAFLGAAHVSLSRRDA
ncbi:MAG: ABC transporter permease [Gemmatimonadota bacterium]